MLSRHSHRKFFTEHAQRRSPLCMFSHRSIAKLKRLQRLDVGNNEIEVLVSGLMTTEHLLYECEECCH